MNYTEKLWEKIEEEEKFAEQSELIIRSLKREKKTGFFEFLRDMFFGLGIKNVFKGVYDVVFITLACAVGLFLFLFFTKARFTGGPRLYGLFFSLSPAFYFIVFLLLFIKERQESEFEVKMTCRYTALHLCAFRMFLTGIVCLLMNALFAAAVSVNNGAGFVELLAVSFSSLFLFALLLIIFLLRLGIKGAAIPAALFGLSLIGCFSEEYLAFIRNIPAAAYAVLGCAAALLFQKILINIDRRYSYAVR